MTGGHTEEPGSLVTSALSHPGSAITGRFTAPRRRSLEGACPHHRSAAAPEGRASTLSVPRHWLVFTPQPQNVAWGAGQLQWSLWFAVPLMLCAAEMARVLRTIRLHLLCVPRVPMAFHASISHEVVRLLVPLTCSKLHLFPYGFLLLGKTMYHCSCRVALRFSIHDSYAILLLVLVPRYHPPRFHHRAAILGGCLH